MATMAEISAQGKRKTLYNGVFRASTPSAYSDKSMTMQRRAGYWLRWPRYIVVAFGVLRAVLADTHCGLREGMIGSFAGGGSRLLSSPVACLYTP